MSLAAIDSDDRARQMISLTERLTQRLTDEVRAFECRRPQLVAPQGRPKPCGWPIFTGMSRCEFATTRR